MYKGKHPHRIRSVSGMRRGTQKCMLLTANNGQKVELSFEAARYSGLHDYARVGEDIRPYVKMLEAFNTRARIYQKGVVITRRLNYEH